MLEMKRRGSGASSVAASVAPVSRQSSAASVFSGEISGASFPMDAMTLDEIKEEVVVEERGGETRETGGKGKRKRDEDYIPAEDDDEDDDDEDEDGDVRKHSKRGRKVVTQKVVKVSKKAVPKKPVPPPSMMLGVLRVKRGGHLFYPFTVLYNSSDEVQSSAVKAHLLKKKADAENTQKNDDCCVCFWSVGGVDDNDVPTLLSGLDRGAK